MLRCSLEPELVTTLRPIRGRHGSERGRGPRSRERLHGPSDPAKPRSTYLRVAWWVFSKVSPYAGSPVPSSGAVSGSGPAAAPSRPRLGSRIRERGRHRIRPGCVGTRGAACVGIAVPSPRRLSGRSGSLRRAVPRASGSVPRSDPGAGDPPWTRIPDTRAWPTSNSTGLRRNSGCSVRGYRRAESTATQRSEWIVAGEPSRGRAVPRASGSVPRSDRGAAAAPSRPGLGSRMRERGRHRIRPDPSELGAQRAWVSPCRVHGDSAVARDVTRQPRPRRTRPRRTRARRP